MITIMETKKIINNKQLVDIACLSTDTKPTTGIMNGSMLIEVNTGKLYVFDESASTWNEIGE